MSDPAHYVVVEPRGVSHYFSNWGGISPNFDLFWGPEHALAFLRKQERVPDWDPEDSFEGGALLDPRNKTMLLFGGEGMVNPLTHRTTLALMRRVWGPDWKLVCAREGLVTFADYLGLPRDTVRTRYPRPLEDPRTFELKTRPRWVAGVVSVRRPDGRVTLHPSESEVGDLFEYRAELVDRLLASPGRPELALPLGGRDMTLSGVHLDVPARKANIWVASSWEDRPTWKGWQVAYHLDRFEAQEEATGDALRFVPLPQHEIVDDLAGIYRRLSDDGPDPHAMLEAMNPSGEPGAVKSRFFTHTPHRVPEDERIHLLDRALAELPELWRAEVSRGTSSGSRSRIAGATAGASASAPEPRRRSRGAAPKRSVSTSTRPRKKST